MKTIHSILAGPVRRALSARPFVLAAALAVGGLVGSSAYAQSTAGEVFGSAPVGSAVTAHSTTNGTQREVHVDERGRYSIHALPVGVYTVTMSQNGKAVSQHPNVPVVVGRGIKVDFQ